MSLFTPIQRTVAVMRYRLYSPFRNRTFAICKRFFCNTPVTLRGEFLRGVKIRGRHAFEVGEPLEEHFLKRIPIQGRVVYDVGANIGRYTVAFARAVGPQGLVVAFEANPAVVIELEETMRLNHCDNVRIINGGVGDREEVATFVVPHNNSGSASCDPAIQNMLRRERERELMRSYLFL